MTDKTSADPLALLARVKDLLDSDNIHWSVQDKLEQAIREQQKQLDLPLFELGDFTLHSGKQSPWRINCERLTNNDWRTLAHLAVARRGNAGCIIGKFGSVEGVPSGGLRWAEAFAPLVTEGPMLIVDDVLTTGASMEKQKAGRDAIGLVLFARGECPSWVEAVWSLDAYRLREREVELVAAANVALKYAAPDDGYCLCCECAEGHAAVCEVSAARELLAHIKQER